MPRPAISGRGRPPGRGLPRTDGDAQGGGRPRSAAQVHAEWAGLLRPDGPFIAVPVLTAVYPQGLDTVPDGTLDKLRLAWAEVSGAPDLLTPAWEQLVLTELLGYGPQALAEGGALPSDLGKGLSAGRLRPDAVVYGPDEGGGRAERMLVYRQPDGAELTRAGRELPSTVEQAAELCRYRSTPLALVTNGRLWALVHARIGEPATTAVFDADLWLEERDLLRAFASLIAARRVCPPLRTPDGALSDSLAALFARSAEAQAEVTDTLGTQVRQAVELLVGELSRLDRESDGGTLAAIEPRQVYRGALTVMMRLVFLLYAEEQRLLPVTSDLYASAYSVTGLYDQLAADRNLYGDEVADRRSAAWPRLLATFGAVYDGCEYEEMRIPPYGGSLFDPDRYPWLEQLAVTDRVVHEILGALLVLRRRGGAAERLSYKGLDVEQIGHVYEGLLEFSCLRVSEPYLGLIGKAEPELSLEEVEQHASPSVAEEAFARWLTEQCDISPAALRRAMTAPADDPAALHAACDNDSELAERVWPLRGLLRTDLRGLPTVFPAGSLVITQTGDRRSTGTHYTPRRLAEEIVKHTLDPLCYSPGPADGVGEDAWQVRPADELLKLKVLDPAMGSGAFLVSACRYLGDLLVEGWERDGFPDGVAAALGPDFDRDDAALEARRRVAARCLHGVDRDEAAVELGKLSLWLVTLAKGQPFSFLDHALRWGDSLVGLTTETQVESFHLDPAQGRAINARLSGAIDEIAGPILTRVRELREEIEAEPVRDPQQGHVLASKLAEAQRLTSRLRGVADGVAAAAISTGGQSAQAFDDRLTGLSEQAQLMLTSGDAESQLETAFRERIELWLKGPRSEPIRPLHWALEFPEVMGQGGFDAIVSNPPFIGGKKVSGALGTDYREYLKQRIARDKPGHADLCSYFLLRDLSIARNGRVGIIATNTISQGDTREVGLDQAADMQWDIYRAEKSQPWPGTASLEVSLVWVGHAGALESRTLDGDHVQGITPTLDAPSRVRGNPYRLEASEGQSFIGSYVLGGGFILGPDEAVALIGEDPRNRDVLFPYLNGEDLNSRWDSSASRWVINFHDWDEERAKSYPAVFEIIEREVKPERQRRRVDGTYVLRKPLPQRWWQYADKRPALQRAIAGLGRVLVITRHSSTVMPLFVETGQVYSDATTVVAHDTGGACALVASSFHYWWAITHASTIGAGIRYTPSDCFETFTQPGLAERVESAGDELDAFRRGVMEQRRVGLTDLYNLVHDPASQDADVARLRRIHQEIDFAVQDAYATDEERQPEIGAFETQYASEPLPTWREIRLSHGFYETRQGMRFTISPQARVDVLDKLLALNHYRHEQEAHQGLLSGKTRRGRRSAQAVGGAEELFDDDGLFRPEGTLF
jgi:hypothetical protein